MNKGWCNEQRDVVGFLQNAWFHPRVTEEQARWYRLWYYAFHNSRSGIRLRKNFGEEWLATVGWENASPQIGRTARSRFPYDAEHITARLAIRRPKIVLAFSEEAERGLMKCWDGHLICIPHPAYMMLTNGLLIKAKWILHEQLRRLDSDRLCVAIRQRRGESVVEELEGNGVSLQAVTPQ